MSAKVILISQVPLPFVEIGSWTTLYDNYLREEHSIDILICPEPVEKYSDITYDFFSISNSLFERISLKLKLHRPWHSAIAALKRVVCPGDKYIIHIIDNSGFCMALSHFLERKGIRHNFYIHYFYHGYTSFKNEALYSKMDELTLLTYKSYQEIKTNVNTISCRVSVLHNGIDTSKFRPVNTDEKRMLRVEFNIQNKRIFIWCSQDRPKKGLHLILDAWNKVLEKHKGIELWIIGTVKRQDSETIKYMGRLPNDDLPKYYQAADVYLFSTLCQEGFPLSLTEALHCGCYCIASSLGGVSEVLNYGKYGRLIENPNFINEWVSAIGDYLEGNYVQIPLPRELYSKEVWNKNMNLLIENAKKI